MIDQICLRITSRTRPAELLTRYSNIGVKNIGVFVRLCVLNVNVNNCTLEY